MSWLLIAITAHFIFALVFAVDKFIVSEMMLRPRVYAFYVGLLGGLTILLAPFGFGLLPFRQMTAGLLAGILFVGATLFFYKSIQLAEVSKIAPVIGGATPIFTLILSYWFLGERLSSGQLLAFFLLVAGGIIMLWPGRKKLNHRSIRNSLLKRLCFAMLAALFFALSFVLTKFLFIHQAFINSFIWTRLGGVLGAGLLLLWPANRQIILKTSKMIKLKTGALVVSNKALAAFAFILLNYAIYLGSVTLVNALQGIQYAFLLIIALFLSKKFPQIIKEQVSQGAILQKIIAILFIGLGLVILV